MSRHLYWSPKNWAEPLYSLAVLLFVVAALAAAAMANRPLAVAQGSRPEPLAPPTLFTDADESRSSETTASLRTIEVSPPAGNAGRALRLVYGIRPNQALGYHYAGVAFPFNPPQELDPSGTIEFLVRPSTDIRAQINIRDASGTNGFGEPIKLKAAQWQVMKAVVSSFPKPDISSIESVAISITDGGQGSLDIATATFPLEIPAGRPGDQTKETSGSAAYSFDFDENPISLGKPVTISDRDESQEARSNIDVVFDVSELPAGEKGSVMRVRFEVVDNAALGYEYAGIAFPFTEPLALSPNGEFALDLRADEPIGEMELVLRDQGKNRATKRVKIGAGNGWQHISAPASEFRGIDTAALQSAALVVSSQGEGRFQIANLGLPVDPKTERVQRHSQIENRTRWFTHPGMARSVARERGLPLLMLLAPSVEEVEKAAERLNEDSAWKGLNARAISLRAGGKSAKELGVTPEDGTIIVVYTPDGQELARTGNFTPGEAERIARLLQQAPESGE